MDLLGVAHRTEHFADDEDRTVQYCVIVVVGRLGDCRGRAPPLVHFAVLAVPGPAAGTVRRLAGTSAATSAPTVTAVRVDRKDNATRALNI